MVTSAVPTSTVSSSCTRISSITPAMGDGIPVSTLSVDTSTSGSSTSTWSPTFFSQRVTVPSVTLSPSAGRLTDWLISVAPYTSVVEFSLVLDAVQRLACEGEECLAQGLILGRVRVDERCDVLRVCLLVDCQLCFRDELADASPDHVYSDNRAVVDPHHLDEAGGPDDVALAVARQVVVVARDVVRAVRLLGLCLGEADRRNLRVGVRDLRDVHVGDHLRVQARDLLRNEDALLEASVGQLQSGNDVAHGVDSG